MLCELRKWRDRAERLREKFFLLVEFLSFLFRGQKVEREPRGIERPRECLLVPFFLPFLCLMVSCLLGAKEKAESPSFCCG